MRKVRRIDFRLIYLKIMTFEFQGLGNWYMIHLCRDTSSEVKKNEGGNKFYKQIQPGDTEIYHSIYITFKASFKNLNILFWTRS